MTHETIFGNLPPLIRILIGLTIIAVAFYLLDKGLGNQDP